MEDGRGIGRGDHFLPHKFIKRTFKRRINSTKQLLNAGRGHQAPRKATHCLRKEVVVAKSLQSCPTLCDPIDGSPPGSPIPGILQARTLEWVAISFSNA